MKIFLFYTTTGSQWEMCGGSYLVIAESKDHAKQIFNVPDDETITDIKEISLEEFRVIEVQQSVAE